MIPRTARDIVNEYSEAAVWADSLAPAWALSRWRPSESTIRALGEAPSHSTGSTSTVVAIGALFGYLVIVEQILNAVTRDLGEWFISNNLLVAATPEGATSVIPDRSPEEALALLTAYVFGFLAISGFLFWRRDVSGSG
jgi:hypothetical protein